MGRARIYSNFNLTEPGLIIVILSKTTLDIIHILPVQKYIEERKTPATDINFGERVSGHK